MARGTTLAITRSMLKAEIGDYSGTNTARDAELNILLSNKQKQLATEHTWPFLERRWDVSAPAGQQFLSLPTATTAEPAAETVDIDTSKPIEVETLFDDVYSDVEYGIGPDEYNSLDYARRQETADPIRRWRLATNPDADTDPNKFEVWPVPANAQTLTFTGQRMLKAFAADGDKCDLDDLLLVLFVAAEHLARRKQADASIKMQLAQRHLNWLKQGFPQREVTRTMDGRGASAFNRSRKLVGIKIIAVS